MTPGLKMWLEIIDEKKIAGSRAAGYVKGGVEKRIRAGLVLRQEQRGILRARQERLMRQRAAGDAQAMTPAGRARLRLLRVRQGDSDKIQVGSAQVIKVDAVEDVATRELVRVRDIRVAQLLVSRAKAHSAYGPRQST